MKIRFITTLLAALLTLSVVQAQEFEFTYKGQTLKYTVTAENEVSVEKLDDNLSGDVIIPSEVTLGKKKYKVTSLGRYSAFGYCKNLQSVVIPNSVTSIGGSTFFACPNLQSVVIPNLVTSIGDSTFMGCSNLQNVVIPNSVTSIGNKAFFGCSNLQNVVIPNSVTSIGNKAFLGCSNLQNVVIPISVTSIGENAFFGCSNLQNVVIPKSVTSIGNRPFFGCYNLQSVTIEALTPPRIIRDFFWGVDSIPTIYVPADSVEKYKAAEGWKKFADKIQPIKLSVSQEQEFEFTYEGQTLKYEVTAENEVSVGKLDKNLSGDLIIPSNVTLGEKKYKVTRIGDEAFYGCKNLQSVVIPNSVTSIGREAFSGCENLQSVMFEFTYKGQTLKYEVTAENEVSVKKLDDNPLGDVVIPSKVTLGKKKYKVTRIGDEAFYNRDFLQNVVIPNSVTSIGEKAFLGCKNLQSVVIPNSVTSIGREAFLGCENLQSVVIPNSVTSIGREAFFGCTLQNFVIPSSVTNIEGGAFTFCSCFRDFNFTYEGVTLRYEIIAENEVWVTHRLDRDGYDLSGELKIPSEVEFESKKYKVTRIGDEAFYGCKNLQSVVIPNSVKTIGAGAFSRLKNLQNVVIPNSVVSIGAEAFMECPNLQGIVIPNSVKTIGAQGFYGCKKLQSISMSESVANIDSFAFLQCTNLSKIEVSPNNRRYSSKDGALYSKSGDTLFLVPKKTAAFTIPSTVKCIGDEAFAFCDSLRSIVIPNSVTSIGKSAFGGCTILQSVVIPNSVTSIKWCTFGGCTNLQSVVIPNSVTSIGGVAFSGCANLQNVVIPNSVTSIGTFAFADCRRLQSIVIPNSVTNFGIGAFGGTELQTFTVEAQTPPAFEEGLFESIVSNVVPTIYVPAASVEKYKAAEGWKNYADKIKPFK
ncbi:MAG: leucine-rich repeat protein [Paludibacteraceae bacterium]|nr:leucine-rich repeat protein [Paludibacteraceae bacterium]